MSHQCEIIAIDIQAAPSETVEGELVPEPSPTIDPNGFSPLHISLSSGFDKTICTHHRLQKVL